MDRCNGRRDITEILLKTALKTITVNHLQIFITLELFTNNTDFFMTLIHLTSKNIKGKGENAGNQHFLRFPQCFFSILSQTEIITQATFILSSANALNLSSDRGLTHYHTIPHFDALQIHTFGKHCEKRRNYLCKEFHLFSQCFLP